MTSLSTKTINQSCVSKCRHVVKYYHINLFICGVYLNVRITNKIGYPNEIKYLNQLLLMHAVKLFSPQLQLEYGTTTFKLDYTHVKQLCDSTHFWKIIYSHIAWKIDDIKCTSSACVHTRLLSCASWFCMNSMCASVVCVNCTHVYFFTDMCVFPHTSCVSLTCTLVWLINQIGKPNMCVHTHYSQHRDLFLV